MTIWDLIFRFHEPVAWFLTFVTIFLNSLLFYFITCKTKHDFGIYKRILKFLSLYNIFYSTTQSIIVPILYASDYYFMLIPGGYLMRFFSTYAQMVLGSFVSSCFGMSLAVLAVHFVYRYIQICHYRHVYLLTGYYQSFWFGYMLFCLMAWMVGCIGFLGASPDKERLLFPDVLKAYNLDMTNRGYVGPQYWVRRGTELEPQFKDWSGMLLVGVATSSTLFVMCICGYKTYYEMANIVASPKTKRLQKQLFVSLIILSGVPLGTIYLPFMALTLGPIIGLGVGRFGLIYDHFLWIPPIFDPLVLIYFISDYRHAAVGILRKFGLTFVFSQKQRGKRRQVRVDDKRLLLSLLLCFTWLTFSLNLITYLGFSRTAQSASSAYTMNRTAVGPSSATNP